MGKPQKSMRRCGLGFEGHLMADSEHGTLIGREMHSGGKNTYLPEFDSLSKTRTKAIPAFDIFRVNTPFLESFDHTAYLLSPEFVQFLVKSLNFSHHGVDLVEQGAVLSKRPRKC
jgi:hypothetical protein